MVQPNTVGNDSTRQGILWLDDLLSQLEPPATVFEGFAIRRQHEHELPRYCFSRTRRIPADENAWFFRLFVVLQDHGSGWRRRRIRLQRLGLLL